MELTVGSKFEIKDKHLFIIDRIVKISPILERIDARLRKYKPIHLCWLFEKMGLPIPRYLIAESGIDVGDGAIHRSYDSGANETAICGTNTANASGLITQAQVYQAAAGNVIFGVFYRISGNTFKCRSAYNVGYCGTGLSTKSVSMAISAGDYIGAWSSGQFEHGPGSNKRSQGGNHCVVGDQTTYVLSSDRSVSIYATGITVPNAPSGCTSHYVATNNAKCTWTDTSGIETGFRIEKAIDGAGFSFWKNVGAGVTDSGTYTLGANHRIKFQVRAYNAAGSSAYSISGYTYTTPTAPSGCTAHYVAPNAYATWADNSTYETGFRVEYSYNSGGSWTFLENTAVNATQSINLDVTGQAKIRFRVRAYKNSLYSTWSESADIILAKLLTGTISITSLTTGALTLGKIETLSGTVSTVSVLPSTLLMLLYSIQANAPPVTSVSGTLTLGITESLSGTSSTSTSVSGSLTRVKGLSATTSIQSSTSAVLAVLKSLSGASSLASVIQGSLSIIFSFSGISATNTQTQGSLALGTIESLIGTSNIASLTLGSLALGKVEILTTTTSATSTIAGSLTLGTIETLVSIVIAQSSTIAQLSIVLGLSTTSEGISTITGSLIVTNLINLIKKLIQLMNIQK